MKKQILIIFVLSFLFIIINLSSVSAVCRYWSYEPCQGDANGYSDGHYSATSSKYYSDTGSGASSYTNSKSVFQGTNAKIYQIRRDYGYENPYSYSATHTSTYSSGYPYFSGGPYMTMASYSGYC